MKPTYHDTARIAASGLLVAAITAALMTAARLQHVARRWYALDPRADIHTSYLHVLTTNLRVCALALLGALLLGSWPSAHRVLDPTLALALLVNAGLVGGALCAYGLQLSSHVITHALLELGAASVSGAAYLRVRRTSQLSVGHLVACATAAIALLALGALLEVEINV